MDRAWQFVRPTIRILEVGMSEQNGTGTIVMVGTARGGFIFNREPGGTEWSMSGPSHRGSQVYHLILDPRDRQMYAAVNSIFLGA